MTAQGVSCVWHCPSLLFGRPSDTSDNVLLAAFIVIITAVHKLHVQLAASATTSTSRV